MTHFFIKILLIMSFTLTLIVALNPIATEAQNPIWPKQTPSLGDIKIYVPLIISMVDSTATPTATMTIEPTITTTATVSPTVQPTITATMTATATITPTVQPTSTVTPTNGITNMAVNTKGAACSTSKVTSGLSWTMTYSYNLTTTGTIFEANVEFAGGTDGVWDYATTGFNDDGNGLKGNVTEVLCVDRNTHTSAKVFAIALGNNNIELARNFVSVTLP